MKDEPSSYQAGVFIVISFRSLLRGTDSRRDRASRSSTNASSLESTKRRKTRTAKHNRGRKRQIVRTDSDERRFDQNLLNGYSY